MLTSTVTANVTPANQAQLSAFTIPARRTAVTGKKPNRSRRSPVDSYSALLAQRTDAAYAVVGAAFVAVSFLNHDEVPKALRTLMESLEKFTDASRAVDQFHRDEVRKQIQIEKEHQHGNTATSKSAA
jgi:hypothetical protein